MPRVRFAPSPTGYLHIGSARTFTFNWLYARRNGGTMILRIDDTDIGRNTQESLDSIFDGLNWLELGWDEQYRDFTPAQDDEGEKSRAGGLWLSNPGMREMSAQESAARAAVGEPFVWRFRVPRESRDEVRFWYSVYGEQAKRTADIEDFALLRSDGMPTYHLASCADDAPGGAKLSKRKHGAVVSVTKYRDAGFLLGTYINFLCLLGWSPKDNREQMSIGELIDAFSFEGVNRANAVVNFDKDDPIDPKALWLNEQHLRTMAPEELLPYVEQELEAAGLTDPYNRDWLRQTVDVIRLRFFTLKDFATRAALTGQSVGPSAFAVFALLGCERVIERLNNIRS